MDARMLTRLLQATQTNDCIAQTIHEHNEGAEDAGKQLQRRRDEEHSSFRALQRNGFGNQLSQDNMSSSNNCKADANSKRVSQCFGGSSANPRKERLDQMRQGWLSNPPESKTSKGDAQLGGRNIRVQMLKLRLYDLRCAVAFFGKLIDTGGTDFHQGKFASDEEAVGCDECHHRHNAHK